MVALVGLSSNDTLGSLHRAAKSQLTINGIGPPHTSGEATAYKRDVLVQPKMKIPFYKI